MGVAATAEPLVPAATAAAVPVLNSQPVIMLSPPE